MTAWAAKRFWAQARAVSSGAGFGVTLDDRPVRTPRKAPLVVPTEALAQAIAAEWQAQTGTVNPGTMPFTRTANSAIDTVAVQPEAVVRMLADYGGSDLLCYRAAEPGLAARQTEGWDPLLTFCADALGAPLITAVGIVHRQQPEPSLTALTDQVRRLTPFQLAAFHDLVSLSGSLVLALAVTHRRLAAQTAWDLSRIDESWQIELWGADEEAAETAALRHAAFLHADRFFALCG